MLGIYLRENSYSVSFLSFIKDKIELNVITRLTYFICLVQPIQLTKLYDLVSEGSEKIG